MILKLNKYFLYHYFLVRSAFKSDNRPGTFKCRPTQGKTSPYISNTVKTSGPNRSAKVTDHFTCISVNVIYCITCVLCIQIYISETMTKVTKDCCNSIGLPVYHVSMHIEFIISA